MYLRYVDNIKENKLDFVTRGYIRYIVFLLVIVLASTLGTVLTIVIYGDNPTKVLGMIFFNIIVTLFTTAFPMYRLIYIVNANEFQNTILSNSMKSLTEFCLIIRENLTLVYKDARFDNIFKLKKNHNNTQGYWLNVFTEENAKAIINAINGKYNIQFDFLGLSVSVIKLPRPANYYLLTATQKNWGNIYNELFNKHKIAIYSTINNKLIFYNKPFEDVLASVGKNVTDIEKNIYSLQEAVEQIQKSLNMHTSTVEYTQTFGNKAMCHMITSSFFDFDEILESPIPTAYLNHDGEILKLNNSFIKNFDIQPESSKQHILDILNEDLSTYFSDNNVKDISIINSTLRKNGICIKLFLKKSITGFIAYCIDFSEIKTLENDLLHSQKLGAIGQLAGGISHDFNNILTAIIGFCDLILLEHCPTNSLYNDIMYIKQSANKGQNLIRQILAFSCKQKLDEKVVCANNIIASIEKFIKCILGDAINLYVNYGSDLWFVKVDINQFEQVIINLIINSKDAIGSNHGKVCISTKNCSIENHLKINTGNIEKNIPNGDYILIQVEDDGHGIDSAILTKVFDPFFSTKEVGKGTGLGLSTVYGIITQMRGYVYVESEIGLYSRFNLLLPRSLDRFLATQNEKSITELNIKTSKNILLIEDEPLIRNFLTRSLDNKGYKVIIIDSTEEITDDFLETHNDIDMVISDVIMPHSSGPEIVEKIIKKLPDIKILFISGYSKDKIDNLKYKFEFMGKPFDFNDLIDKIEAIFAS